MAQTKQEVLVIAAHPDDEVLGCGATLLKWKDAGHSVKILFGGTGRLGGNQRAEAEIVAEQAGWEILRFGDFKDNEFGPVAEVARFIESTLRLLRPHRIMIHADHDNNQDHAIMRHAALLACRPYQSIWKVALGGVREIWSFEIPGSTRAFSPNIYLDVKSQWERKGELVMAYSSEYWDAPHPRNVASLTALAKSRATFAGMDMAETFCLEFMGIGRSSGVSS